MIVLLASFNQKTLLLRARAVLGYRNMKIHEKTMFQDLSLEE